MPPQKRDIRSAASILVAALVGLGAPWLVGLASFSGSWVVLLAMLSCLLCIPASWPWRDPPNIDGFAAGAARGLGYIQYLGLAVLAMALGWVVGGFWLQGFPISDDIYAAMMQAKTFASGKLAVPAPPVPEAFTHPRFIVKGDVWISQYPPGWAVLLTPLAYFDLPFWLAPGVFCAGIVVLFWRIARRRLEPPFAALALISLVCSSFFVLNATSLFSHAPTTFFALAAVEATFLRRQGGGIFWAFVAGIALGAMGLIRPFNAVIFIVVLGGVFVVDAVRVNRRRAIESIVALGLGGFPFAVGFLAYNQAVTGSAFVPITSWLGIVESVGVLNEKSIGYSVVRLSNLMLTTSPLLVVAWALTFFKFWRMRRLNFTDLIFPATLMAFLFYGGAGGRAWSYGPRYLFEAFPFLVLTVSAGISLIGLQSKVVRTYVIIHFVVQLSGLVSWLVFERVAVIALSEPYRLVQEARLENAIVVLEDCPVTYRGCHLPDLTRNGLDVNQRPVIYAVDAGGSLSKLRSTFPDRSFWVYRNGALKPLPD